MKALIKKTFSKKIFKRLLKGKIYTIAYHDISDLNSTIFDNEYSTTVDIFKKHINFLQEHFTIISINDLSGNKTLDPKKTYVIITFDDGFRSVYDTAFPLLKKSNIPFSVFINSSAITNNFLWFTKNNRSRLINYLKESINLSINSSIQDINSSIKINEISDAIFTPLGGERLFLNVEEMKEMKEYGVVFGNHTHTHYNLNNSSSELLEKEIKICDAFLRDNHLLTQSLFAIPFGKKEHYNAETLNLLKRLGYQSFSTNPYFVKTKEIKNDSFSKPIPRIGITNQSINELIFYFNRTILQKIDI